MNTDDLTPEEEKELSDLYFRVYTDLPVGPKDFQRMLDLERKTKDANRIDVV